MCQSDTGKQTRQVTFVEHTGSEFERRTDKQRDFKWYSDFCIDNSPYFNNSHLMNKITAQKYGTFLL